MKQIKSILSVGMLLTAGLLIVQGLMSDASAAKKPKGLIIPEGDNAVLTEEGSYTKITFPETLTPEDMELYSTNFAAYILSIGGKMSTDGNEYKGTNVYYYVHNSKEWLHKGQYELPGMLTVSKIKYVRISKGILRLRDFNKEMPLREADRENKNDSGYQDELMFGENRYTFIEIVLRD